MKTISERIKAYLDYSKVSQAEFGENAGRSAGWVNNAGKSLKSDVIDNITKHYPELSIVWLTTGEGSMILPPQRLKEISAMQNLSPNQSRADFEKWLNIQPSSKPPPPTDKKADALDQLKKVTNGKNIEKKDNHIFHTLEAYVLPVKGRLGLGSTYYADSYFEDKLEKTTVSVTKKPINANRFILAEFEGESMTDGSPEQIPDGSWVILAERKRGEDWDANMEGKIMGFFDKNDNFTIKKVKKHDKHFKYVILEALNPDKTQPENQDRELEIKNCWAIYDYVSKLS